MGGAQTVDGKFSAVSLSDPNMDGVTIAACANHCRTEGEPFFQYFDMLIISSPKWPLAASRFSSVYFIELETYHCSKFLLSKN